MTRGRAGWPRPNANVQQRSDLHPQGAQHRIDGFKARMRARTQGFVQALPTKAGVSGRVPHSFF